MGRIYTLAASRALGRINYLDAIVQIGTSYGVDSSHPCPLATYEDMTIRQAIECRYPEWIALSDRRQRQHVDQQRRSYENAAVCCTTTKWAARSIIEQYGVSPEKVHVVGVGLNHVVDPPDDRDWSTPRFLFVGWEWERKNGPGALKAFRQVRREIPEARLDLVGKHPCIDAPGVTDHGALVLNRPEDRARLEALFRSATCFVMPSHCEPSALAYVEAMHAGLPCIGTTVGGAADLIDDAGVVVDPSSNEALVDAMLAYANPDAAASLGTAARCRSRLFTWPAVAGRIVNGLELAAQEDQLASRSSS